MIAVEHNRSRIFYASLALAISATAFYGFYFTYFSLIAIGVYPSVSPAVHVHGWSFFLWNLLFPLQAILIATGRKRLHFMLGGASVLLATVMVFTGLLVASVRIDDALTNVSDLGAFWEAFGLIITFTLLLFVGFYSAAIANRKRPQVHKRLMVMASATILGAAVYRIMVTMLDYHWLETPMWFPPAAIFLPNLFIVAGIIYDLSTRRSVHPVYVIGLPIAIAIEGLGLWLATSPAGDSVRRLIAAFSDVFGFLY